MDVTAPQCCRPQHVWHARALTSGMHADDLGSPLHCVLLQGLSEIIGRRVDMGGSHDCFMELLLQ